MQDASLHACGAEIFLLTVNTDGRIFPLQCDSRDATHLVSVGGRGQGLWVGGCCLFFLIVYFKIYIFFAYRLECAMFAGICSLRDTFHSTSVFMPVFLIIFHL